MLPSVRRNVDVLIQPGLEYRPGSDEILLIEAGGFYSRKYSSISHTVC